MSLFKYETHLHTIEGSACGSSYGADYIEPFYNAGYAGIFVTDHFFGGNTAVSREGLWADRVEQYCKGYENALAAAKVFNEKNHLTGTDKEFKVFFGIEQTFNGDDYLLYGFTKEWLLAHPEIETMKHQELFAAVNSVGGLMIQAHPFRLRGYQHSMYIHPRDVHGVEVYNGGNKPEENQLAALYAHIYDFPQTSGSDIHTINFIPDAPGKLSVGGMAFTTPLKDVYDYAQRVKNKNATLIR